MLNFKKVAARDSGEKNSNKNDQAKYEKKVEILEETCNRFVSDFENVLYTPQKWKNLFDRCFQTQMKKNKLTSRTSRILNAMSKNLSKFKGEFDLEKLDDYIKAFSFTPEKAKKGYIKRSAIDDKKIENIFNLKIPNILVKTSNQLKMKNTKYTFREIQKLLKKSEKVLTEIDNTVRELNNMLNERNEHLKKISDQKNSDDYKNTQKTIRGLIESKENILKYKNNLEKYRNELANAEKKEPSKVHVGDMVKLFESTMGNCDKSVKNAAKVMQDAKAKEKAEKSEAPKGVIVIKSKADFDSINEYEKSDIKKVIIRGNILEIKGKAFNGFNNLEYVELSEKCVKIWDSAFASCSSLKVINLASVEIIGDCAFSDCKSLGIVSLKKATTIGNRAFAGCRELVGPSSGVLDTANVKTVGSYAFNGCEKLKGIDLGKVEKIDEYTFAGCNELVKVLNAGGVTTISNFAFAGCEKLKEINLKGVTTIGENAFAGCKELVGDAGQEGILDIGKVTGIKVNAFKGCEKLEGINLKGIKDPTSIGNGAFAECSKIKIICLSKDIKEDVSEKIRDLMVGGTQLNIGQTIVANLINMWNGLFEQSNKAFKEISCKGIIFRLV